MAQEIRSLTCINCPLGCEVTVHFAGNGEMTVTGNTCPRGEAYGKKEVTDPTRIVTSTVPVDGGDIARLPVKTAADIPKGKIFDALECLKTVRAKAPVKIGDVIIPDVAGTGTDIVATANM